MITKYRSFRFLLLFIIISMLYYVACQFSLTVPLSMKKAQLSPTTQSLVSHFNEPIELTLYSTDNDTYHETFLIVEQYQRLNKKIHFEWKKEHYTFASNHSGEALVARFQEQQSFIDLLKEKVTEANLSSLLFKFKRQANNWIVFLQGHGEPQPFGKDTRDYSLWRKALENQGLKVQGLSLTQTPVIADNVKLLIIASMQSECLPQEEQLIREYLEKGGSLLWLTDPSAKPVLFLQNYLHLKTLPGTIVDLHGQQMGTPHAAITLIENYPSLPFSSPMLLSAYPWSVALTFEPSVWQAAPLLKTHDATWTETGPLMGQIQFDPEKGEVAGPLLLGVSFTRTHPTDAKQEQRIAVIGNSRFMSNGIIQNYGNLAFGQNLISWLNGDDALLTLEQPVSSDSFSHIHVMTAYLIQYAFPGIGLLFILVALLYGWKRNFVKEFRTPGDYLK